MRIGGGAVALGVVAVGVGIVLGVESNANSGELTRLSQGGGAWDAHAQNLYTSGQAMAGAASGLLVAGAVVAVGGAAAWLFGWRREVARAPSVALGAAPGSAALVVRWSY